MKFLLYLLLGYTVVRVDAGGLRAVFNFCNQSGIKLRRIREEDGTVRIWLLLADEKKLLDFCAAHGCNTAVCTRHGLPILWRRYRHRIGMWLGLLLFLVSIYVAPLFVWEVRVVGLNRLSRSYVCELLAEEGVHIGAFSPAIDRNRVYLHVLRRAADISWLSVNLRGSTATVEIVERDMPKAVDAQADGANLVAARSGQIVHADVVRGALAVKSGDVVQKGALLVSGVIDSPTTGTRYLYAEGEVLAAVSDTFETGIPLEGVTRRYAGEETLEASVSVFGKTINIFKNYSISDENYDTIYRENNLPFPGLCRLPLTLLTTVALPYTEESVLRTENEALAAARAECRRWISEKKTYAETLAREEHYAVEGGILHYTCTIEAIENIAATAEYNVRFDR